MKIVSNPTSNKSRDSFGEKASALNMAMGKPIRWKMQTFANSTLGEQVIKPAVDTFNRLANGEMYIDLYYADEIVPNSELFKALKDGIIDCIQGDDDSIGSQADIAPLTAYFPLETRYSLDVSALFNKFGLGEVWADSYKAVGGVTWLGASTLDTCNLITKSPINRLSDLKNLKIYTSPTIGSFLDRFGVKAIIRGVDDIESAMRKGEIDGIAYCGISEAAALAWANASNYFLTNNISGAWLASFLANTKAWEAIPEHLRDLFKLCMDSAQSYRQYSYWEEDIQGESDKLKLTAIDPEEWKNVEIESDIFWSDIAAKGGQNLRRAVDIFAKYSAMLEKAGAA